MKIDDNSLTIIFQNINLCKNNIKYFLVCKKWNYILNNIISINEIKYNCKPIYFLGFKLCYSHQDELINKIINTNS